MIEQKDTFNIELNHHGEFVIRTNVDGTRVDYTGHSEYYEVSRHYNIDHLVTALEHYGWPEWSLVYYNDFRGPFDGLRRLVLCQSDWSQVVASIPNGSVISIYLLKKDSVIGGSFIRGPIVAGPNESESSSRSQHIQPDSTAQPNKLCQCNATPVIRTSWTTDNFGRRFYGCPFYNQRGKRACDHFVWFDKIMCPQSQIVGRKVERMLADARNKEAEKHAKMILFYKVMVWSLLFALFAMCLVKVYQ